MSQLLTYSTMNFLQYIYGIKISDFFLQYQNLSVLIPNIPTKHDLTYLSVQDSEDTRYSRILSKF